MRTTPIALAIAFTLAACTPSPAERDDDAVAKKHQGHRAAAWVVDRKTHKLLGFAEGSVTPGQTLKLQPPNCGPVTVTLGKLAPTTHSDFRREWQETTAPVKIARGTGHSEATLPLDRPHLSIDWGSDRDPDVITFLLPVGSLDSKPVADATPPRFKGEPAELEDLFLAAAAEGYVDLSDAAHLYTILGTTAREGRWLELTKSGDWDLEATALTALTRTGHPQATERFCELALGTTGNRQVELAGTIPNLPQSEKMLETIVALVIAPRVYVLQAPPGVGIGDDDRRNGLIRAALNYPPEQLKPHAPKLLQWADANKDLHLKRQIEGHVAKAR